MPRARPTLRCLRDDLCLSIPPANELLDEISHPLLAKATEQFASEDTSRERIRAVDDQVLFKVKAQRWRGAVWTERKLPWLVAGGQREAGSPDDFYAALAAEGRAARARFNATHKPPLTTATHTAHLLPDGDDRLRYRLEAGLRLVRRLEALIPELVLESLRDGREHAATLETFTVGVQVRADSGNETYVAICIVGSVPENLTKIILDVVPGCASDGWYPEGAMPERPLRRSEQAWSSIMDTTAAAKLLEES